MAYDTPACFAFLCDQMFENVENQKKREETTKSGNEYDTMTDMIEFETATGYNETLTIFDELKIQFSMKYTREMPNGITLVIEMYMPFRAIP